MDFTGALSSDSVPLAGQQSQLNNHDSNAFPPNVTLLHPRSNRHTSPVAAQNQSPTTAIRIHSISQKTHARDPNQSPTFCHFAKRAFRATRNFHPTRHRASFSAPTQPTSHQPASSPGGSRLNNHFSPQCSLPYQLPATVFARDSGLFTPTGGRYLSTIGPFRSPFGFASLSLQLFGHLGHG